jgi:hypothetical protein
MGDSVKHPLVTAALILALPAAGLAIASPASGASPRQVAVAKQPVAATAAAAVPTDDLSWDAQFRLDQIGDATKAELGSEFGGEEIDRVAKRLVVHFSGTKAAFDAAQSKLAAEYGTLIDLVQAVQSEAGALKLKDALASAIQNSTLPVSQLAPLPDGRVRIWTSGDPAEVTSFLAKSGIAVTNASGASLVDVVPQDVETVTPTTASRSNDTSPWNAGDFLNMPYTTPDPSWCTSGPGVHTVSNGHRGMLTASHCFNGATGNAVDNQYVDNDLLIHGGGAYMGSLQGRDVAVDNVAATLANPTTDSALVDTLSYGTSNLQFTGPWNSTSASLQAGTATNVVGDKVCMSGAYDGEVCNITIQYANVTRCILTNHTECLGPAAEGWDTSNASALAVGKGDSGGSVYSYSGSSLYQKGVNSFGGGNGVACPNPAGSLRQCFHVIYWAQIQSVLSLWGKALNT